MKQGRQGGLGHLFSGKACEVEPKAAKKPVRLVNAIDGPSDDMKLIAERFEGVGKLRNSSCATFQELEINLEMNFFGFGMMTKGIFKGFFNEGGEQDA